MPEIPPLMLRSARQGASRSTKHAKRICSRWRGAKPPASTRTPLGVGVGGGLDALHVVVAEAEMVADLVDQHMAHQMGELLAALAPVVEQRPAIEEDAIEVARHLADGLAAEIDAAIEPEQVERR